MASPSATSPANSRLHSHTPSNHDMKLKQIFPIEQAKNGQNLINLGCGIRVHPKWTNVDFTPYTQLRKRLWLAKLLHKTGILSDLRWHRLNELPENICSWNFMRGIPFPNDSFDAVYHSHFLEHLNKDDAPDFLLECYRVCKPNGIIRIVVPDLEGIISKYMDAINGIGAKREGAWEAYDTTLYDLFDQMVRFNSVGTQQQKKWIAKVERMLRGGPGKVGELHRWMYDRHSLSRLLCEAGFADIQQHSYNTSGILNMNGYDLDIQNDGKEYKKRSLYMEGRKPS